MKKHLRWIIAIIVLAVMGVGYYYYLANKPADKDATESVADSNSELSYLVSRNIEDNYPESVRDVVKLYARITKAYYESDVSEENIEKLGRQARILFDDELKNTQTEDEFLSALKEDISIYRNNNAKISSFNIQTANNTRYTKFNNREYASIELVYYIREGTQLRTSGTKFTLRRDNSGKWKILYWELVDSVDLS